MVREFGKIIEVMKLERSGAKLNASFAISVTPSGIDKEPRQLVFVVTMLLTMVKVPLVPQLTVPSATAWAGLTPTRFITSMLSASASTLNILI